MASILEVALSSDSVRIVRECEPVLRRVLNTKFGCNIEIHDVESGMEAGTGFSKKPFVPEKKYSVSLNSNVHVSVWQADLSNFKVEAVVNAANRKLEHCGGLALTLSKVGGPEIQKESNNYIKQNGDLKIGDAICTGAGNLPCKMIIHAVGPCIPINPTTVIIEQAATKLKRAVMSILDIVERKQLHSVAIPALSSGLFNFPLSKCADIIVNTLKEYYTKRHSGYGPIEIQLVNIDEPSVTEMERACHQILEETPKSSSWSIPYQTMWTPWKNAAKSPTVTFRSVNASLTLKKGHIEDQETDVIVNTTAQNLDLSMGEISKAILKKAGNRIQSEIKAGYARASEFVYVTKSYNLKCEKVYHTMCASKKDDPMAQTLHRAIWDCLTLAVKDKCKSISFPAIGSGNLGFSRKEVSQAMMSAAVQFTQTHQDNLDIYIVIYPSDDDTFKAFEVYMTSLAPVSSSSHVGQTEDFQHSRAAPWITLSSNSAEMTSEARRWLKGILSNISGSVTICNNFFLHFGEREFKWLSSQTKRNVSIEEFFENGRAGMTVKGNLPEEVLVIVLQLEAMLCDAQNEFITEEEHAMALEPTQKQLYGRKQVDNRHVDFIRRENILEYDGLQVVKVEKVVNPALEKLFELRRKLNKTPASLRMYQRISAQFCDMVSHIGFNTKVSPPDDPRYGEGIYFTSTVRRAMEVWRKLPEEEYLYFVEAHVLTGKSIPGQPGLIVPPPVDDNPLILYDSVSGGNDINVIFSGYQALPEYIITCKMVDQYHSFGGGAVRKY